MSGDGLDRPPLRIVGGGTPTAAELAALVVALAARASRARHRTAPASAPAWADRRRLLRLPPQHGAGRWRRGG